MKFFFYLKINVSYADISYLDLKGVHDIIIDEHQAQLSPVFGYTLLGTGSLENRRFYGNYGPKKKDHSCFEKTGIGQILKDKDDCPQDFTSEWIQRLFPSQDGVNFVANQLNSDPISHLSFSTIGEVLTHIAEMKDEHWADPKKVDNLQSKITGILFQGTNTKAYFAKKLQERNQLVADHSQCKQEAREEKESSIIKLNNKLEDILNKFSLTLDPDFLNKTKAGNYKKNDQLKQRISTYILPEGKGSEKDFQSIAHIIVNALKESKLEPHHYPKYLIEQSLMAFFLKKANNKNDLISLFKGMKGSLKNNEILIEGHSTQKKFLLEKYDVSEYDPAQHHSNPVQSAKNFARNPEKLVFSVMQDHLASKALPPLISYGSAKHSALENQSSNYADCGETSLRNFFNIVTYDQKTGEFDANHLVQLNQPPAKAHRQLVEFYKTHKNPSEAGNQQVRDAWSEDVASKHMGVNYLKPASRPQCEIDAGIDNMMKVVDGLLFHGALAGGPIETATNRSAKLDQLCDAVSRKGFQLTWNTNDRARIDSNNTNVAVQFSINGALSFVWDFQPGHFAMQDLTEKRDSWKDQVGSEFVKIFDHNNKYREQLELLFSWFSSEKVINETKGEFSRHFRENLIYALPLNSSDAKLIALRMTKNIPLSPQRIALTEQICAKLPQEDVYTQKKIADELLTNEYPLAQVIKIFESTDLKKKVAIYSSISKKNILAFKQMADHGFPLNIELYNQPLSILAASSNMWEAVKLIAEREPHALEAFDKNKMSAAHLAVQAKEWEVVKFIAQHAPNSMNLKGQFTQTPPILVANQGEWEVVKFIAQHAPNSMSVQDQDLITPMSLAIFSNKLDVIQSIAKQAPSAFKTKSFNLASLAAQQKKWDILKFIAEHEPSVMTQSDKYHQKPIEIAEENLIGEDSLIYNSILEAMKIGEKARKSKEQERMKREDHDAEKE